MVKLKETNKNLSVLSWLMLSSCFLEKRISLSHWPKDKLLRFRTQQDWLTKHVFIFPCVLLLLLTGSTLLAWCFSICCISKLWWFTIQYRHHLAAPDLLVHAHPRKPRTLAFVNSAGLRKDCMVQQYPTLHWVGWVGSRTMKVCVWM